MLSGTICLLDKEFYKKTYIKEMNKKSGRLYLYLSIKYKNLYFLIPFESKLFLGNPKGIYLLPTVKKPDAGINFEKVIILKDTTYIIQLQQKKVHIPRRQTNKIKQEIKKIEKKFEEYVDNFIKACQKNREKKEAEYRYSTLHYYKPLLVPKK